MKYIKAFNNSNDLETYKKSKFVSPHLFLNKENLRDIHYLEKYQRIEYLEGTGTQHINTNLICSGNYRFKVKFVYNSLSSPEDSVSSSIFGARYGANDYNYQLSSYHNGCFGYNYRLNESLGINQINAEYIVEFNNNNELYINDVLKLNDLNESFDTPLSLIIFALHNRWENEITEHLIGRIYYFTLYNKDNNETILDLIPIRKGNIGYMYDKVSNKLFGNDGTGDFILGPDI